MASGNARPAAKQNMGDEAMKTHGLKSGLNAYMIVVTLCPRFVPLSYSHAAISCTRSMPSGTHLSQLTKALLKLVSGLRTRVGISRGGGGGSVCDAVLVLVCIEAELDGEAAGQVLAEDSRIILSICT